jgi:hypothetical protein
MELIDIPNISIVLHCVCEDGQKGQTITCCALFAAQLFNSYLSTLIMS